MGKSSRQTLALALLVLLSLAGRAQTPIWSLPGFGAVVRFVGDVNGDQLDDLVALGSDVRVLSGADGRTLVRIPRAASDAASAGDFNADGVPDFMISATASPGAVLVLSGRGGQPLRVLTGTTANTTFGRAIAGIGDANGDGFDDIAVSASSEFSGRGALRIFSGVDGSVLQMIPPPPGVVRTFGNQVAAAGDVDNDGFGDVLVSEFGLPTTSGTTRSVWVFSGADGSQLHRFRSARPNDRNFGASIAGIGDLDGDGHDDLFIGTTDAPGDATVFSGANGTRLLSVSAPGPQLELFGNAVAGLGDITGDGIPDLAVAETGRPARAAVGVHIFSGLDGAFLMTIPPPTQFVSQRFFGLALAGGHDVNGSPGGELIIGSPNLGTLTAFDLGISVPIGTARRFGAGCRSASDRQPRIGCRGRPTTGQSVDITLRGGPLVTASAALALGTPANVTLASIGRPDCALLVAPLATALTQTPPSGMANLPLALPMDPALIGTECTLQWWIADPRRRSTQSLSLSDALQIVVGA